MKFSNDLSKAIFLELRKPFNHSFFSFQIYFGFVLANFEAFFSHFHQDYYTLKLFYI